MDDFILLIPTKEEAKYLLKKISLFLQERLKLSLNQKSRYFPNYHGVDFCGYRIFETHIILRKRFKKKIKGSLRLWKKLIENNRFNYNKFLLSYNSYKGHAKHSNSYNLICKYEKDVEKY